ncbi:hypothetical protein [Nocardiopsis ganjiahuensis]|uniref:hypothetical protein n=1 Tax=Nocardiopsis ganjiahuensis TaxID=239984 RepID=UPI00034962F3|nr:hypothetical protein [Nocardiopsis ganjiahuensis]
MIGFGRRRKRDGYETPVWSIAFRSPDTKVEFQARVPSASEGMGFEASFEVTIAWNGAGTAAQARARALVQRQVIQLAKKVSSGFSLGDRGSAEAEIACALAEEKGTREEVVREVAVLVTLAVDEEDLELERERERVGPRNEIHRAAHRARMDRVREIQRDVLSDPQVARVWWFEQNPDLLHDIENAGAALDLMSTPGAKAEGAAEQRGDTGDPVLDAFLGGLEEWEVPPALERLTTMLEGLERRDLADQLRERWLSN